MKRREFFQWFGNGAAAPDARRLELACDLLQVHYAQALMENRSDLYLDELREQLAKAERVTVRNEGLLRGEMLTLFQGLFAEYEARGKRLDRRQS